MKQVPPFEWSQEALKLRQFVYEFWCERAYGPNMLDMSRSVGLTRRQILDALYELQMGGLCVLDLNSPNLNLLRFLPFSSYPTGVKVFIGDRFLGFVGCAMESVAFSKMPPYAGKEVRIESYCPCCLTPVTVTSKDGKMRAWEPESLLIHVGLTPWEWNKLDHNPMCDSMNYVLNADHAGQYEQMVSRRGVAFTMKQAEGLVKGVADNRMIDYNWPFTPGDPARIIEGIKALGVDVSPWGA
ncbi:MAG: organomercurial lyase [Dehalococcoidia bacterium]